MKLIALLIAAGMLVSACVPTGPGLECAGWRPIILDRASVDGLSERDAEDILSHNLFGRERGCWR